MDRPGIASLLLAAGMLLAGCSPSAGPAASAPVPTGAARLGELTPYVSPTAATGATAAATAHPDTPTPLPSPTPTPRTHVVKKGEDMGGIAFQYGVSIEALMAANPTVQPNLMSVGTKLVIPPSKNQKPGDEQAAGTGGNPLTPTPMPVEAGRLSCTPAEDGGVWCFLPVKNTQSFPLEGLSAVFRLSDGQAQTILPQTAFLPLDRLMPGGTLPLAAYFPPEQAAKLSPSYQSSSEMLTALTSADNGRYLPAHLENSKVLLAENGLSAVVSADILLDGAGKAKRVWVAVVAYGAGGDVVGVRRWEKQGDRPLGSGQPLPMWINVYSVSEKIVRVELTVETRP